MTEKDKQMITEEELQAFLDHPVTKAVKKILTM